MPPLQRTDIPEAIPRHLLKRIRERDIPVRALGDLANWIATSPEVPDGQWFKRFRDYTLCGEDRLAKTILKPNQTAIGTEIP